MGGVYGAEGHAVEGAADIFLNFEYLERTKIVCVMICS